ncbi:MAG: hypothetical protein GX221_07760 [Candidatus Riflebacteria bacterium]|nr:hypothetical protein [Candidatus Riflebacteria bacterium]
MSKKTISLLFIFCAFFIFDALLARAFEPPAFNASANSEPSHKHRLSQNMPQANKTAKYVTSKTCRECHADIYKEWQLTPHARMVRTLSDLDKEQQAVLKAKGLDESKVKYVLGSHYVHRFVTENDGDLKILPKVWDIHTKEWSDYTDPNWERRLWLKQCAGCHTTGFDTTDESFAEAGIGCEACHGPGSEHAEKEDPAYITSIRRMTELEQEMICMSCHTSGIDNSGEYDFPVGYKPGDDLAEFFSGLTPKPGQTPSNFAGDETIEDREKQWHFLKSRLFLASGLTCDYCKNFRSFDTNSASEYLTYDQYCLTCHQDYADHPEESPGTDCAVCHMPSTHMNKKLSIHDHKFKFPENF